jgi:hypothetical protein
LLLVLLVLLALLLPPRCCRRLGRLRRGRGRPQLRFLQADLLAQERALGGVGAVLSVELVELRLQREKGVAACGHRLCRLA